jgi:hypothetical protein
VVYPNSGTSTLVYISDAVNGDGYYGSSDGLHTVMYAMSNNFVGTVTMQATLMTTPGDGDWFDVTGTTSEYTNFTNNSMVVPVTNMVDTYNFVGNFVYVRGKVQIDTGAVFYVDYNH